MQKNHSMRSQYFHGRSNYNINSLKSLDLQSTRLPGKTAIEYTLNGSDELLQPVALIHMRNISVTNSINSNHFVT